MAGVSGARPPLLSADGAHDIHHLVREYGIVLVFLAVAVQAMGPPVPGTTVLIAAAVAACGWSSDPFSPGGET